MKRLVYRSKRNKMCFITVLSIFISCFLILNIKNPIALEELDDIDSMLLENSNNSGCQFPKLDPFSKLAMRFNKNLPKVVCYGEDWVECNITVCKVKNSILDKMSYVMCYYKDIIHVDDHNYKISEPIKIINDGKYILNRSDYFKVSCFGYEKNCFSIFSTRWHGYKSGIMHIDTPQPPHGREDSVNVLILGLDSTSHHGVLRKLPKTYDTIKNELNGVVLNGYNIVGDGTPSALFPILSGRTEVEHHPSARQRLSKDVYLNPNLFIFHTVKQFGYQTAYFEDMPAVGSFQYRYNGFSRKPADHYLRSFFLEETKYGAKWWNGRESRYCIGATPSYMFLLDLTKQFMSINSKRFCFTFIADISHDEPELLATADEDLVVFLREFKNSGKLDDTLLIIMGDHGPRFSPLRAYYQGKIEERMPFVSIVLPTILKRKRPDALSALQSNVDVLTSPFDMHTTLLDAMDLKQYSNSYSLPNCKLPRGMSLLAPIPRSRRCEDAGILPHWCVCRNTNWLVVSRSEVWYEKAANALAEFVNNITVDKRSQCEERTLRSISWVIRQHLREEDQNKTGPIYYQASIVMNPGASVFEGTVQYFKNSDRFEVSEKDVSRISPYGSEPACISATHPNLNKYCYCRNKLFVPIHFLH